MAAKKRGPVSHVLYHTGRNIRQMWPVGYAVWTVVGSSLLIVSFLQMHVMNSVGFGEGMMYILGGMVGTTDLDHFGGYLVNVIGFDGLVPRMLPVLVLLLVQGKYLEVAMRSYCRILVPRIGSLSVWWSSLMLSQLLISVLYTAVLMLFPVGIYAIWGMDLGDLPHRVPHMAALLVKVGLLVACRCLLALQLQTLTLIPLANPVAGLLIPIVLMLTVVSTPVQGAWFPAGGAVMAGVYMGETSMAAVACSGVLWYLALAGLGWLLVRRRDFLIAAI